MDKGRLEAFSDGVIAVAITLLILDITVPSVDSLNHHGHVESLAHALAGKWPEYAAYVTSFLTIGIIWINHHAMVSRLRQADHVILILNLLLLMTIAVIPFGTSLMATYVRHSGQDQHLAAAVYAGTFLLMSIAFASLNRQILFERAHLMHERHQDERLRRTAFRRSATGLIPYVVAVGLAFVSAYVTLVICAALAVFYAFPFASGTAATTTE